MAGRRKDTIQLRVHISTELSSIISILSDVNNKPKGVILEELLDKTKIEEIKHKIYKAVGDDLKTP